MTGEGNDSGNHGVAILNSTVNCVGGSDIEALHTDIDRQTIDRCFLAGQQPDQLLDTAAGIPGRHRPHRVACPSTGGGHGGDGFRLIILDTDQHLARFQQMRHDVQAGDDFRRALTHEPIVAGNPRLALGAVQNQRFQMLAMAAQIQLDCAGKGRPAQADHACVA